MRGEVEFEHVDLLVHSAGAHARGKLEEASVQQLDSLHRSNVRAPYRLTQCLLPRLNQIDGTAKTLQSWRFRLLS